MSAIPPSSSPPQGSPPHSSTGPSSSASPGSTTTSTTTSKIASWFANFKLIFSSGPSVDAIDAALKDSSSTSVAGNQTAQETPAPSSGPVPAVDDNDDEIYPAEPAAKKTKLSVEASIKGIPMEFTLTVEGRPIPLTPEMIDYLIPLFEKLTKDTDGKLSRSFACAIDLNDSSNFHIYQNGNEIFKEECAKAIREDGEIQQNITDLIQMVSLYQKGDINLTSNDSEVAKSTTNSLPDYIEEVPGDGNCLLYAALKHIKNDRSFEDQSAVAELRRKIANAAFNETENTGQLAILADIQEARETANRSNLSNASPFSLLFSDEINQILDEKNLPDLNNNWNVIKKAYQDYITNNDKAYLGSYAILYLNQNEAQNKLFVVKPGQEKGTYVPQDATGEEEPNIKDKWVLLLNNNHYQYVDSTNSHFLEGLGRGIALAFQSKK